MIATSKVYLCEYLSIIASTDVVQHMPYVGERATQQFGAII